MSWLAFISLIIFIHFWFSIKPACADECNQAATLVEFKKIYMTQPLDLDSPLSFNEYIQLFDRMSRDINSFKDVSQNYTTDEKMDRTEPLTLHPFDEEHNIIHISKLTRNIDAIETCKRYSAQLLTITNGTKERVAKLLNKLGIEKVPFQVVPLHHSIYSPNGELIEMLSQDAETKIKGIHQLGFPYFSKDSVIYFATQPSTRKRREPDVDNTTTTEEVGTSQTTLGALITTKPPKTNNGDRAGLKNAEQMQADSPTVDTFTSPLLCLKKNNMWDRPTLRKAWNSISRGLQHAGNTIEKLIMAYRRTTNIINNFTKKEGMPTKILKITAPSYMKDAVNFLQKFRTGDSWEHTTPNDSIQFEKFIANVGRMDRHLTQKKHGFLSLQGRTQQITIPIVDEHHWLVNTPLKDTSYGIIGPAIVRINETWREDPQIVEATIRLSIFDRQDPTTIFKIQPNIIHGNITTAKFLIASKKYNLALMDEPIIGDCTTREGEEYAICKTIDYPFNDQYPTQQLLDCGASLRKPEWDSGFDKCPKAVAGEMPIAYRAQCKGEPTAIINANKSLRLNYICDGTAVKTEDIKRFPALISTSCEIQEVEGDVKRTLIPQAQHDLFQDEPIADAITPLPPATTTTPASPMAEHLSAIITGSVMAGVVVFGMILIIFALKLEKINCCCPSKCRKTESKGDEESINISAIQPNKQRGIITSSRLPSRQGSPTPSRRSRSRSRIEHISPVIMF